MYLGSSWNSRVYAVPQLEAGGVGGRMWSELEEIDDTDVLTRGG